MSLRFQRIKFHPPPCSAKYAPIYLSENCKRNCPVTKLCDPHTGTLTPSPPLYREPLALALPTWQWHLVGKARDLFKLVHLRTPLPTDSNIWRPRPQTCSLVDLPLIIVDIWWLLYDVCGRAGGMHLSGMFSCLRNRAEMAASGLGGAVPLVSVSLYPLHHTPCLSPHPIQPSPLHKEHGTKQADRKWHHTPLCRQNDRRV